MGFAVGVKGSENERGLRLLLEKPNVKLLFADEGTIAHYAMIYKRSCAAGRMIPKNDLWIAGICAAARSGAADARHAF